MAKGDLSNTGWLIAGTGQNVSIGSNAWSNPGNITAEDSTYATVTSVQFSDWLMASNFGVSIPAGAEIRGIELKVNLKSSATSSNLICGGFINDPTVAPSSSTIIGGMLKPHGGFISGHNEAYFGGNIPTTEQDMNLGDPNWSWGMDVKSPSTLRTAVQSSNFGVALRLGRTSGTATIDVDSVQIRVHYWLAADIPSSSGWIQGSSIVGDGSHQLTFTNIGNSNDNNVSTFATTGAPAAGNESEYAIQYTLGLSIPSGKVVTGIEKIVQTESSAYNDVWRQMSLGIFDNCSTTPVLRALKDYSNEGHVPPIAPLSASFGKHGGYDNIVSDFGSLLFIDHTEWNNSDTGLGATVITSNAGSANKLYDVWYRVFYDDPAPVKITPWEDVLSAESTSQIFGGDVAWANPSNAVGEDAVYSTNDISTGTAPHSLVGIHDERSADLLANYNWQFIDSRVKFKADVDEALTQKSILVLHDDNEDTTWTFLTFGTFFDDWQGNFPTGTPEWYYFQLGNANALENSNVTNVLTLNKGAFGWKIGVTSSTDTKYADAMQTKIVQLRRSHLPLFSTRKFPGTVDGTFGGTGTNWTNPGNVTADDNVYATCSIGAGAFSNGLRVSNFGFSIPAGNECCGIALYISGKQGSGTEAAMPAFVEVVGSDGTVKSVIPFIITGAFQQTTGNPNTLNYNYVGHTFFAPVADLLTADMNHSNFGLNIVGLNQATSTLTFSIDSIEMRVWYQPAGSSGEGGAGAEGIINFLQSNIF